MADDNSFGKAGRILIVFASFVIIVAGIRDATPILVPMLTSAFIAVICSPTIHWLNAKGIRTGIALVLVISFVSSAILFVIGVAGTSLNDFVEKLPQYQLQLIAQRQEAIGWLKERGIDVSDQLQQTSFDPSRVLVYFRLLLSGLSSLFSNAFLVLLTLFFILLEAAGLPAKMQRLPGAEVRLAKIHLALKSIRHYMAIKTWISIWTGVLIAILMKIIGVDYPLLWGLLAFCFNFVPNIGSIIAAVPAIALAFLQLGPLAALYAALGFLAVNIVVGNLIEPRMMGRGLGLSTLVVFLSLIFWGWVLGPIGMILSVPLTMTAKIAMETSDETKWLAILLSSDLPEEGDGVSPVGTSTTA